MNLFCSRLVNGVEAMSWVIKKRHRFFQTPIVQVCSVGIKNDVVPFILLGPNYPNGMWIFSA
jgi:hypothetical protein